MADMPPDDHLQVLAATLASARGEDFFPVLAAHLGVTRGARESLICEAMPGRRARAPGAWPDGNRIEFMQMSPSSMQAEAIRRLSGA
jgi:hypothetical protein